MEHETARVVCTLHAPWNRVAAHATAPVAFPLTPALSLGEREPRRSALEKPKRLGFVGRLAKVLPLPKGEGWGEGERTLRG